LNFTSNITENIDFVRVKYVFGVLILLKVRISLFLQF